MSSTAIRRTRIGYYYQDLYALLVFLSRYMKNEEEILGFFVDCEYDAIKSKSDDVVLNIRKGDTTATEFYDIKTGDDFRNKHVKVLKVVGEFSRRRNIGQIKSDDTTYLVVSHDNGRAVATFKQHVDTLTTPHRPTDPLAKKAVEYFSKHIPKTYYKSEASLHESIIKVSFKVGAPPLEVDDGDEQTEIRSVIKDKISGIATKAGIVSKDTANSTAFPEDNLVDKMLGIVQNYAGTNLDMTDELKAAIEQFYARYKTRTKELDSGDTGGLSTALKDVRKALLEFETGKQATDTSPVNQVEGGEIS